MLAQSPSVRLNTGSPSVLRGIRTHRRITTHGVAFRKVELIQPVAACQASAQSSKAWDNAATAEGQTREDRYTLSQMYLPKRKQAPVVQLDHSARRRAREIGEIAESAKRVGLSRAQVEQGFQKLESLLPDLAPNLDKMKASSWVVLIQDVNSVAQTLIVLKSYYPRANISKVIARSPKILLQSSKQVEEDALEVQALVAGRLPDLDAIIEVVPDLLKPAQMQLSLSNLKRWFNKDPFELLQQNPNLLNDIEEATLEADPTYGETLA
uniref:Uncharacterized protein n=1 Tax=Dunaliella tertiolecta TaxID=3047 RepID=A0A6S8P9P5_DUNTE|mmetsp:Transcript_5737/g.13572  ORF Transcript_5737/g.13572 Transcript_5737/m.13572 type:complete len:267 (-) Transcript_5737:68-868(-)